ncbi:MAG: amino acid adenylation domain-containing protein, partial [bacterium]|nr:amino acid adenylation domain-containing protein [bacterium]
MDKTIITTLDEFEDVKNYWLDKLNGQLSGMKIFSDFPHTSPHTSQYRPAKLEFTFPGPLSKKLIDTSKGNELSLYVILLTALNVLLSKLSGETDIRVVSPVYSVEALNYNKYIIFRNIADTQKSFKELLMEVNRTVLDGYKNQHYPMEKIVEFLDIDNMHALFGFGLFLKTIHPEENLNHLAENYEPKLIFSMDKKDGLLEGEILYNGELFNKDTINRLTRGFLFVLSQGIFDTGKKIAAIEINDEEEKEKILNQFNDTRADYPETLSIPRLFDEQANKNPQNTALLLDNRQVTYNELKNKADRLAGRLIAKGIKPGDRVAILAENSIAMIVAILGILKTGAAYLPIAPSIPDQRKTYILENSKAAVIVFQKHLLDDTQNRLFCEITLMPIDEENEAPNGTPPLPENIDPLSPAYAIYTSGTTGNPKGVLVNHRGIVNYTTWRINAYQYTRHDVTLQLLNYNFDGFCSNLYSSLLSGGTLALVPETRKNDFFHIVEVIKNSNVTNISFVPGMYEALLESAGEGELKNLRFVVLAGEKTQVSLIEKSNTQYPALLLINEYGPTEATVAAIANIGMNHENNSVIGKPIANTRIYILDRENMPTAVGTAGEICISGAGISNGYIDMEQLNHEKFVANPFIENTKMYRTGDTGRWLPDGTIEYLGREDNQIKIRGFRVEIEEIKRKILHLQQVKEAVVVPNKNEEGDTYLCAHLVFDNSGNIPAIPELRRLLALTLPDYMIPSYFLQLEEIPRLPNGKIDIKALFDPEAIETET